MGLTQQHALGRNQRVFVSPETTANTLVKATAGAAVRVKSSSIKATTPREPRSDARDTRSLVERITRASEYEWALSTYLLTGMDPGDVTSRLHPLLYAVMGGYTNTPGTSDLYSLSSSQVARTLSICRQPFEGHAQETVIGAMVNQAKLSLAAGAEPMAEFSGPALRASQCLGVGTIPTGATSANQTLSDASHIEVDSVVYLTASDGSNVRNNTSAGYRVTAKSGNVITLESSVTTADGDLVYPFVPTPTDVGVPISGITGSLTIDSVACPVKSLSVTINNNITTITEALAANPSDATHGWRDVTGELVVRARADLIKHFAGRKGFAAKDLQIVHGAAGNRITLDMATIELDATGELNLPVGNEEGDFTLPFVALDDGEGELTITID